MKFLKRKEPLVLLVGDLTVFLLALWGALLLRTLELPSKELYLTHLTPFAILFVSWILVFYIAGLYEKQTTIIKHGLPNVLANTQLINSALAVIFFYFIPYFLITPKTILFIHLFVSFALILFWRTQAYFHIIQSTQNKALVIGSGDEMKELLEEVNENPIYNFKFVSSVDLSKVDGAFWNEIVEQVYSEEISIIVIDLMHDKVEPILPHLYNLIFSNITFIDMHKVYEDVFNRVPLSLLQYNWFLENISSLPRDIYDSMKRLMDICISIPLLLVPIITYPFLLVAIKMEDGGPVFIIQERVGKNNKTVKIHKFRSMSKNEVDPTQDTDNQITRVGKFVRKTRLDEFPQLWSVLKGDLSLIGPRPELPGAVKQYTEEIPYYNVRHLIKPGLSGWAQIYHDAHPHHSADTIETKNKLSYDIYYIKNRSFLLDLKIALRTMKTLVSIAGK